MVYLEEEGIVETSKTSKNRIHTCYFVVRYVYCTVLPLLLCCAEPRITVPSIRKAITIMYDMLSIISNWISKD